MLSFDHLLPEGVTLFPFQTVGVAYALVTKRCIIGDEMGLGKTLQALTTLEAAKAYPALVVCPKTLKGNWEREIKAFLPHREVRVIGSKPNLVWTNADIVVVNYDIVNNFSDVLEGRHFRSLVMDESHMLSNPDTLRTRAVQLIAESLPEDGYRLALTGTVINNKPRELVSQLEILGRLTDVAPAPTAGRDDVRSWELSFEMRYCQGVNEQELNQRLRACCYVRRQRFDVTGMKNTKRIVVPLALNGALDDYRAAEAGLVRWLYEQKGAHAARSAIRGQAMSRFNTLRQLAGRAKIEAAKEWITNFLLSNPERSLVVFAYHREVQRALVEHYACPSILGGATSQQVEEAKSAFQEGGHRLIVCSLTAASTGHTLTKAADVLMVEQGWTPGLMSQAEDRCNRIGQTAEQVFAWYLHGAGTVDERVYEIIDKKRHIFAAVAEGRVINHDHLQETILDDLIDSYSSVHTNLIG
jgi:SWI/SNF-related matrix-associated actin-dependent regulator 1 of chromatin subfamily A